MKWETAHQLINILFIGMTIIISIMAYIGIIRPIIKDIRAEMKERQESFNIAKTYHVLSFQFQNYSKEELKDWIVSISI